MSYFDDFKLGLAAGFDALTSSTFGKAVAYTSPLSLLAVGEDKDNDGRISDDVYAAQTADDARRAGLAGLELAEVETRANAGADASTANGGIGQAWRDAQRKILDPVAGAGAALVKWGPTLLLVVLGVALVVVVLPAVRGFLFLRKAR